MVKYKAKASRMSLKIEVQLYTIYKVYNIHYTNVTKFILFVKFINLSLNSLILI